MAFLSGCGHARAAARYCCKPDARKEKVILLIEDAHWIDTRVRRAAEQSDRRTTAKRTLLIIQTQATGIYASSG